MKKSIGALVVGALISVATPALAQDDVTKVLADKVSQSLRVTVDKVTPSPIEGMYQAYTNQGILYISADGNKLFHGKLYSLENGIKDLTSAAMDDVRLSKLGSIDGTTIDYKAKDEKYVVTVFTDITCGYCRKLHESMSEYNELGITVRYMAYPRAGRNSKSWDDMAKVWCSVDQRQAMDDAKGNIQVNGGTDCGKAKYVSQHYDLGGSFGVTGTPAIVTADGGLIPGFLPPEQLLMRLKQG